MAQAGKKNGIRAGTRIQLEYRALRRQEAQDVVPDALSFVMNDFIPSIIGIEDQACLLNALAASFSFMRSWIFMPTPIFLTGAGL